MGKVKYTKYQKERHQQSFYPLALPHDQYSMYDIIALFPPMIKEKSAKHQNSAIHLHSLLWLGRQEEVHQVPNHKCYDMYTANSYIDKY